jgi:hypothetical protein
MNVLKFDEDTGDVQLELSADEQQIFIEYAVNDILRKACKRHEEELQQEQLTQDGQACRVLIFEGDRRSFFPWYINVSLPEQYQNAICGIFEYMNKFGWFDDITISDDQLDDYEKASQQHSFEHIERLVLSWQNEEGLYWNISDMATPDTFISWVKRTPQE